MGSIKSVISKKKDLYSFYNMVPCLKIGLEVVVFLDLRKIQNTVQSTYNEKLVILNKWFITVKFQWSNLYWNDKCIEDY
jgi:hypothetical protein